jgi:hypothetical protein
LAELSLRNTVEFAQVALCLVPEILDSVDVIMGIREEFGVVDPETKCSIKRSCL